MIKEGKEMRKGTFSAKRAGSNSAAHNSRINPPKYLIGLEENSKNYYKLFQSDEAFILEAQKIYKDKIGQSMQKKQLPNLVQETVLTLKKNQDENDVIKLFEKLHLKFGGHELLEVSVHRDEGHFEKGGIAFYPTKNILKKDDDWYIQSDPNSKEFDIKVDISDFKKKYNYHAHAKFSMFDKNLGKTARMQKRDMSERIKFVSEKLGLLFTPDPKTSRTRKSVKQVKNEYHSRAKAKQEARATINQVKAQYKQERRQLIDSHKATTEDYAELRRRYRELEEEARKKELTISELKERSNNFKIAVLEIGKDIKKIVKVSLGREFQTESDVDLAVNSINEMKEKIAEKPVEVEKVIYKQDTDTQNKLIEAQETIKQQNTSIDTLKESLSSYKRSMSSLQAENKELKTWKRQVIDYFKKIGKIVKASSWEDIQQKIIDKFSFKKENELKKFEAGLREMNKTKNIFEMKKDCIGDKYEIEKTVIIEKYHREQVEKVIGSKLTNNQKAHNIIEDMNKIMQPSRAEIEAHMAEVKASEKNIHEKLR